MKKKTNALLPAILIASLVAAGTSGCSAASVSTPAGSVSSVSTDSPASKTETSASSTEASSSKQTEGTGEYLLLNSNYSGNVFTVNSAGEKLAEFDREEIIKRFSANDIYINEDTSILGAIGKTLFVDTYVYSEESSAEYVYALDTENTDACLLWGKQGYEGQYLSSAEVYNGSFYMVLAGDNQVCREYRFDKAADSFFFEKTETGLIKAFQAVLLEGGYYPEKPSDHGYRTCYSRLMDEYGYLVFNTEEGKYFRVDREGNKTALRNFPDHFITLVHCDKKCIIYREYGGDNKAYYYRYELETSSFERLPVGFELYDSFLGCDGDTFYYFKDESEEYGHVDDCVYAYNFETGSGKLLYEQEGIPGAGYGARPGIDGFTLINGQIYALTVIGDKYGYARVNYKDGKPDYTNINCFLRDASALSHGSVSYVSNTSKCANCGTVLVQFYEECFKLDSSFSKNAAKINDYLSDKASQSGEFMSRTITSTEEECAEHKEWPDHYLETQEFFVNGVEILSGKYLTVNMAGYWYGGGAHGESLRAQYIFNLDTGDYVTLEDLFPGTEEEFKKLIAEKTKEDCEGNIYRYYNPEPDYVYNEAYSFASFYTTRIEFYEDRALLVYAPYDMGPYAAGYIEIPLTYEELLGRPGL